MLSMVPQRITELVKQGIALARRRPFMFLGIWALKWFVVYIIFVAGTHSASGDSLRQKRAQSPVVIDADGAPRVGEEVLLSQRDAAAAAHGDGQQRRRPFATIDTDLGEIVLEFLPDDAPKTVQNFIELARRGFFNGTTLYRYEKNFVLQGGGWPRKVSPLPPVPLEYSVPNYMYHVSTARTADPNSATCEYSIMLNDNSKWLGPGGSDPHGYAVFARVVGGVDVIGKFAELKTRHSGLTMLDPAVGVRSWVVSYR